MLSSASTLRTTRLRAHAAGIALLVGAVTTWSPTARADDAAGGLGFLVYSAQFIVPSEAGLDLSTVQGNPRFRLIWSNQIPLAVFSDWRGDDSERDHPLLHHRIVLALGLAFGNQPLPGGQPGDSPTFDFRAGYRYRFWHAHRIAPFFDAGSTVEGTSDGSRWSISPELGVHVGGDRVLCPGLQLRVQGDAFVSDVPHVRFLFTAGYTFI